MVYLMEHQDNVGKKIILTQDKAYFQSQTYRS